MAILLVSIQAVNPILRPLPAFPPCFSFAALIRRISRISIFSVTSHYAGSSFAATDPPVCPRAKIIDSAAKSCGSHPRWP